MSNAPDKDLNDHFWADVQVQIEPELPATVTFAGSLLSLKQTKDETVGIIDDGNGGKTIGTITNIVTAVKPSWKAKDYVYDYPTLKKEFQQLAQIVGQNHATLKGQIIVRRGDNNNYFRLVLSSGKIVAQAALLGWEDGTKSPYPEFGTD